VLVQGYTLPENLGRAAAANLSVTVSSWECLALLPKLKKNLAVHLKVDTGMHRHGFQLPELPQVLKTLQGAPRASLEGLYTHLAAAKEPRFRKQSEAQLERFKTAVHLARAAGFSPICHAAATGGTLWYPKAHYGMVRIGIGLYGLWPSPETEARFKKTVPLTPAMSWKSVVAELKWVEKGERVGYNFTERLTRRSRLALVPVGYWHGYGRALSGRGHVLVRGHRCKVVGLVSMDILTVDATDAIGARVGDEVVLIGRQGKASVTAAELAKIAGTTAYEIVTRTNPLIKKFFV
jgi:alanine racemase